MGRVPFLLILLAFMSGCSAVSQSPQPTLSQEKWTPEPTTGQASTTVASPSADPSVDVGVDPEFPTPLRGYMYTVSELSTMLYANGVFVDECMNRFGFEFPVATYASVLEGQRAFSATMISRMFGVVDRGMAERYGYLLPTSETESLLDGSSSEDPSFNAVLLGEDALGGGSSPGSSVGGLDVPEGGCAGEARRRLGVPDGPTMGDLARRLWAEASQDVKTEPGYVSAVSDWRECVSAAGFEVTSPLSDPRVGELVNQRVDPDVPSLEEVNLALADIDCKERTDLVARLSKVTLEFEEKVVEENQVVLQENRDRLSDRLAVVISELEAAGRFQ